MAEAPHQPHTVVRGHRFDLLVIVHDLHLAWPVILPPEINPPGRVDPDAVLPGPIADAQRARRDAVRELAASASARPRPVQKTQTNSRLAPGRFDRHRPMASPRSGACRRRCRRFGFPVRAGKTPSSNGIPRSRAETRIQARDAPGPERASRLRRGSPGLDSGPLGRPLFRRYTARSAPVSLFGANVALENRD